MAEHNQTSAKFPSTVELSGPEVPEKYRRRVDFRKILPFLPLSSISGASNTTTLNVRVDNPLLVIELPVQARVWHKACAKRAGLTDWWPWKVDRDVSCSGCGRKLARKAVQS